MLLSSLSATDSQVPCWVFSVHTWNLSLEPHRCPEIESGTGFVWGFGYSAYRCCCMKGSHQLLKGDTLILTILMIQKLRGERQGVEISHTYLLWKFSPQFGYFLSWLIAYVKYCGWIVVRGIKVQSSPLHALPTQGSQPMVELKTSRTLWSQIPGSSACYDSLGKSLHLSLPHS